MADEAERDESSTKARRSRRELLAGAAGALGVIAAETIGRATPARAADGDPVLLGLENFSSTLTIIGSQGGGLEVVAAGSLGVEGTAAATDGIGVHGLGGQTGIGVLGAGDIGVQGDAPIASPNRVGVLGKADAVPAGTGVLGKSADGSGVVGKSATGAGIYGVSGDYSGGSASGAAVGDSTTKAGVVGLTSAPTRAAGEFTHVAGGRGGLFSGGKAQLRLHPSSASTHPTKGQRGDLFVDKSGRLWFCKGRTTWVQLA
jgi:hypothetical protein